MPPLCCAVLLRKERTVSFLLEQPGIKVGLTELLHTRSSINDVNLKNTLWEKAGLWTRYWTLCLHPFVATTLNVSSCSGILFWLVSLGGVDTYPKVISHTDALFRIHVLSSTASVAAAILVITLLAVAVYVLVDHWKLSREASPQEEANAPDTVVNLSPKRSPKSNKGPLLESHKRKQLQDKKKMGTGQTFFLSSPAGSQPGVVPEKQLVLANQ
jgi:hypothetical protein